VYVELGANQQRVLGGSPAPDEARGGRAVASRHELHALDLIACTATSLSLRVVCEPQSHCPLDRPRIIYQV
jgi:hypothetical protein